MIGYDTAVRLVAPRYYAREGGQPGEETTEMLLEARLRFQLQASYMRRLGRRDLGLWRAERKRD